jgi:hypothetical protein
MGSEGIAAYDGPMAHARRPLVRLAAASAALGMVVAILTGCAGSGVGATPSSGPTSVASDSTPESPAATAGPKASRPLNVPPLGGAAASAAYAEFLAHIKDDESTVDRLDGALMTASNAADLDAVRKAAVGILDFVDVERDWLLRHTPAECYVGAYGSAMAMLEAYGGAGDAFVSWSTTGGGLNGLPALGRATGAASGAQAALAGFTDILGRTSCPG